MPRDACNDLSTFGFVSGFAAKASGMEEMGTLGTDEGRIESVS
jgi:hypothetical protein